VSADLKSGRVNQKRRTRQALVDAATQVLARGGTPTLEQIAEAALVSRATAYRYFKSADEAVAEALLAGRIKTSAQVLGGLSRDPVERLLAVEAAVNGVLMGDERAVHMMARAQMDEWLRAQEDDSGNRNGRRLPLIDDALAEVDGNLTPAALRRLRNATALAVGPEAVIALRDVCGLGRNEARRTAQWAIRALVLQARAEADAERTVTDGNRPAAPSPRSGTA
jgi:AcrR family transcriptional regulator